MNTRHALRKAPGTYWFTLVTSLLGAFFLYRLYRWRKGVIAREARVIHTPDFARYTGLSDEEARERRSPEIDQLIRDSQKKARQEILRQNAISIFNLSLVGLAVSQIILQDPLGALLTIGTLILNIVVNMVQELISIRKVAELRARVSPLATVMRSGRLKGVPVKDLVPGDLIFVQVGDEFPVNGELLSENKLEIAPPAGLDGGSDTDLSLVDHRIIAGSQCKAGWALYRSDAQPALHIDLEAPDEAESRSKGEMTELQKLIDRLLRWMLGVVVFFLIVLTVYIFTNLTSMGETLDDLLTSVFQTLNLPTEAVASVTDMSEIFYTWVRVAVGLIFSLAPSGLFFMIVVTYAVGVADIGKFGALVRRPPTVESLAQVTTLCLSKGASLSGADVQMEVIPWEGGAPAMPSSHVARILGTFARSQRNPDFILKALADNFEGEVRRPELEFYYLNAFGWGAVNFEEIDLQGTYVLGHPDILRVHFEKPPEGAAVPDGSDLATPKTVVSQFTNTLRKAPNPLRRFFGGQPENEASGNDQDEPRAKDPISEAVSSDEPEDPTVENHSTSRITKTFRKLGGFLRRNKTETTEAVEMEETRTIEPAVELFFAYTPEPQPLFSAEGTPRLPENLVPLCKLTFIEQMRLEARQVVQTFLEAGVQVKILASDEAARVQQLGMQLGVNPLDESTILTGAALRSLSDDQVEQQVSQTALFGELDARQKAHLVNTLHRKGEFVAFFGEHADDELALRQAQVRISSLTAYWTVLRNADIVMIKQSIEAMAAVFQKGQRIVNGLMNVLKLNLIQILYILVLLVVFFLTPPTPFYYHPTQGGMIVFFSVVLPSIGLSLWAPKGAAPRAQLAMRLARFVIPAALSMSLIALLTFYGVRNYIHTSVATAQLAVTHAFVYMGLLLALFAQPPSKFWTGGSELSGDRRISWMVVVVLGLWTLVISIPIAHELLLVNWLNPLWLQGVIALGVIVWGLVLRAIWRSRWIERIFKVTSA